MRWYRILIVVCLVGGLVLRMRGFLYSGRPFWVDEADWALHLLKRSLLKPSIRPIGFVALTRFLVLTFGAHDVVLRLVPFLSGIGTLLLSVPLAEKLLPNRASRLLFVGTLAFHPVAIDYSKEYKPYSCSLFLHLLCALFAVRYLRDGRWPSLVFGMLTGFLGLWFAQDLIFALPGFYLVALAFALRRRNLRQVGALALGAVTTVALLLGLYFFFWRQLDTGNGTVETTFWGHKYDVFHNPASAEGLLHWIGRKYVELAEFPSARREQWHPDALFGAATVSAFSALYAGLWLLLHGLGLFVLVRQRRFSTLTLLGAPIVTLLGFNLFGFWPFGPFRTNLFLLLDVAAIAAFGVTAVKPLVEKEALALALAVALPFLVFERDWHAHKRWAGDSDFFDVTRALVAMQGDHQAGSEPLVLDYYSCAVFRYYLSLNPDHPRLRQDLENRFTIKCTTGADAIPEAQQEASEHRVWLVLTDPSQTATARERLASMSNVVDHRELNGGRDVLLEFDPAGQKTQ
jgi:hypothetical protein